MLCSNSRRRRRRSQKGKSKERRVRIINNGPPEAQSERFSCAEFDGGSCFALGLDYCVFFTVPYSTATATAAIAV